MYQTSKQLNNSTSGLLFSKLKDSSPKDIYTLITISSLFTIVKYGNNPSVQALVIG